MTPIDFACVALAYFMGAIPSGVILAHFFSDIDVRDVGSGNIGATNVTRAMGRTWGAVAFLGDMLKGALPVLIARAYASDVSWVAWTAIVAVLGHLFPVYLKFKGGKGVSTTMGVTLAMAPLAGLASSIFWLVPYFMTRMSSVGGLVWAAVTPLLVYLISKTPAFTLASAALAVLIVIAHRANIRRLIAGEELAFTEGQDEEHAGDDDTSEAP